MVKKIFKNYFQRLYSHEIQQLPTQDKKYTALSLNGNIRMVVIHKLSIRNPKRSDDYENNSKYRQKQKPIVEKCKTKLSKRFKPSLSLNVFSMILWKFLVIIFVIKLRECDNISVETKFKDFTAMKFSSYQRKTKNTLRSASMGI